MLRLICLALLWPVAAAAQPAPHAPAPSYLPEPAADGRMFGHLPYAEALPDELAPVPYGFSAGAGCQEVNRAMLPDLQRLLAAANLAGVGRSLHGISCYRSVARQSGIFCHAGTRGGCVDPAIRAIRSGPPGYSEHATGYAIDFQAGCAAVSPCFALTAAGRWMLAHASDYGFELSFPDGNGQGVSYEPWHWRWVGRTVGEPGATAARALFATARDRFPAFPAVRDGSGFVAAPAIPQPFLPPTTVPLIPYPSTPTSPPAPDPDPDPTAPAPVPGLSAPRPPDD